MKRAGFTMIELIFVIVILGILAAVAVPKLAATRTDAALASSKSDIGTISQAIPAYYQGQKDMRMLSGTSLDTSKWAPSDPTGDTNQSFTLKIDSVDCVIAAIYDENATSSSLASGSATDGADDYDVSSGKWNPKKADGSPVLIISKHPDWDKGEVCKTLWTQAPDGLGVVEANITMGGKKVQW